MNYNDGMATKKETQAELDRFGINLANRASIADRFLEHVQDKLLTTRKNRYSVEDLWLEDLRLWSCRNDDRGYQGYSNVFVPELNSQVESSVEKAILSLFPSRDYIYAIPNKGIDQAQADKIKNAVLYELEDKSHLSTNFDEFERQKVLYGTSVMKGAYHKDPVDIFVREKGGKTVKKTVYKKHGVSWNTVDLFRWYIYPEVSDLDSAEIIFEDDIKDLGWAKRSGLFTNLDNVQAVNQDINMRWVDITRYSIADLSSALVARPNTAVLTEVWCDFPIREGGEPVPCMGVIANHSTVVRLVKNPFWFQSHPYAASRYTKRPGGIFYGQSLSDRIRSQQYQMNDITNQTMDSINYALNPIAIIDPALAGDINTFKISPGAKWLGSPEGVRFEQFSDVSPTGLRGIQELRGQIAQFSDNTPGIAPQLQGKSRSATQASIVQASVSGRQKLSAKAEEDSVLVPICKKTHIMLQQFQDESYQIKIQGPEMGSWITQNVDPDDLVGDVEFVWRGSSEEERNAVRSQQLLAFYNSALQTAAVMPGEVDLPALFRRVAKEAFNLRDMDEIFKSLRDKKTVDPEVENIALMNEQEVDINFGDDDEYHQEVVKKVIDDKKASKQAKLLALRHYEKHEVQKKAKAQVQQNQARIQALQSVQSMQNGPGAEQGQDGRSVPQAPSPMEGNQAQSMSSPDQIYSSIKGVQ